MGEMRKLESWSDGVTGSLGHSFKFGSKSGPMDFTRTSEDSSGALGDREPGKAARKKCRVERTVVNEDFCGHFVAGRRESVSVAKICAQIRLDFLGGQFAAGHEANDAACGRITDAVGN